ncbi:MAG: response regulator [Thermodesulfobacteriota bacterium]
MISKTILVVDDEEDILELVRYNLTREGYRIITAETGETAVSLVGKEDIDLIVLDLMLPGMDGLEVTRYLKNNSRTRSIPIIMLTAKGEEPDIVAGLELGADDYITKPFSPRVLMARVKAVVRRRDHQEPKADELIRMGELTIHPGRHEVAIAGQAVELTLTEFQILQYLSKRPGWVATRSQIVDAVRGVGYAVTDRSVDVQIVGLRKKMGQYSHWIQTVRGVGYKFREKP